MHKRKRFRNRQLGDRLMDIFLYAVAIFAIVVTVYPVYFVLIASVSSPTAVNSGQFLLWPEGFQLSGYKFVFQNKKILTGYYNTLLYTATGLLLSLSFCIPAGYALSRKDLPARKIIMKLLIFTMYFSGGLIPNFLVVRNLNLLNSRWAVILPGLVSVYNIILVRSYCESSLSEELLNAARIDGCGNGRFFFQFVIPLSKAIIAVIALYVAVGCWNGYRGAMIYLNDEGKYPLQLILRQLLLAANNNVTDIQDGELAGEYLQQVQVVKYAVIVAATAPIMCIYPFLQKYFVQGVMIGSIKG